MRCTCEMFKIKEDLLVRPATRYLITILLLQAIGLAAQNMAVHMLTHVAPLTVHVEPVNFSLSVIHQLLEHLEPTDMPVELRAAIARCAEDLPGVCSSYHSHVAHDASRKKNRCYKCLAACFVFD